MATSDVKQGKETRLTKWLYETTPSEAWHLAHPGAPSPRYQTVPHLTVEGVDCLLFDWEHTLLERPLGLIKETRYTSVPAHVNRDMELSFVYDGTCDFVIGGKEVALGTNDVVIFDTEVVRSSPREKGEHDIVVSMVFRREFFDSVFLSKIPGSGLLTELLFEVVSHRRRHDHFLVIPGAYVGRARQLVEFIAEEYQFPSDYSQELIRSYVEALILELVRGLYQRAKDQNDPQVTDRRLASALAHIEDHYKECTLTTVAQKFGYNPTYLGNLLKKSTGRTFSEIRLAQQMREARFLLANTDRSITSIAEKVGISNMTYFYRKFNEHFRMSPRTYRQSARSAGAPPIPSDSTR